MSDNRNPLFKSPQERTEDEDMNAADKGLGGQGSVVKALYRVRDALDQGHKDSTDLTRKIYWLTIAIVFLTVAWLGVGILGVLIQLRIVVP